MDDLDLGEIRHRVDQLREQEQQIQEEATRLGQEQNARLQERENLEQELTRLRAERDEAKKEEQAYAFLPGDDGAATATAAKQRVAELQEEIDAKETAYEDAKERWEVKKAELAEIRRELAPLLLELSRHRVEEEVDTYEAVADAVLDDYEEALAARSARNELLAETRRVIQQAKPAEGDPRIHSRQRQEARAYLQEVFRSIGPKAALGFLLVDVMNWTRRGTSPCGDLWDERGVERLDGSTEYADPVPAPKDTLHRLRQGSLPVTMNL